MNILVLLFLTAFVSQSWAAPIPGTSSSQIISEKAGSFYSPKGFSLHSGDTAWVQTPAPKNIPSIAAIYKSPIVSSGQQPALTVRFDELKRNQNLKNYVKHWMQDYTRFGFDVLTAKAIKISGNSAFLIDIVSKETKKQLRQVVFMREKLAVILTCRDERGESFNKTLTDCNSIIKTFQWESATK